MYVTMKEYLNAVRTQIGSEETANFGNLDSSYTLCPKCSKWKHSSMMRVLFDKVWKDYTCLECIK